MTKKNSTGREIRIYISLTLIVLLVIIAGWYWYRDYSTYISTDDAHVESDNVQISAKMLGRISKLHAIEGDTVKQGTLLVELDSLDLLAQKNQVRAVLEQASAQLEQAKAKLNFDRENIRVFQVSMEKAKEDYDRAKLQVAGDVITREQYDHMKKAYETAVAQLDAAKTQLSVSKAQVESANATIGLAEAQIQVVVTQLANTRLYAPFDGIITRRWLLGGDVVQPGQSVFSLTGKSLRWVVVYLEETKMADVHLNQEARFTIDTYGSTVFTGKVFSIGASTAGQFSLIPANNASGNFTKVTQRVPIKISIDSADKVADIRKVNLMPGMSAVVKIIKDK